MGGLHETSGKGVLEGIGRLVVGGEYGRECVTGKVGHESVVLKDALDQRVKDFLNDIGQYLCAVLSMAHYDIGDGCEAGDIDEQRTGVERSGRFAISILFENKCGNQGMHKHIIL